MLCSAMTFAARPGSNRRIIRATVGFGSAIIAVRKTLRPRSEEASAPSVAVPRGVGQNTAVRKGSHKNT